MSHAVEDIASQIIWGTFSGLIVDLFLVPQAVLYCTLILAENSLLVVLVVGCCDRTALSLL